MLLGVSEKNKDGTGWQSAASLCSSPSSQR